MMYIHYCKYCRRIHILNGHKVYCPACSGKLTELGISYMKYVNLSKTERGQLKEKCADEKGLKELSVEYRMHRYSKWFKNLPGPAQQMLLLPPLLQIINNHACQNTTHACKFPYRDFFSKEKTAQKKDKHIAKRFNHRPVHERKSSESADIEYGRTQKQHVSANHPGIQVFPEKGFMLLSCGLFQKHLGKGRRKDTGKKQKVIYTNFHWLNPPLSGRR